MTGSASPPIAANIAAGQERGPFSRTVLLALIGIGFVAFLAMLYGLSSGIPLINQGNGRAHAASKSLVGYHALVELLRADGLEVELSRSPADRRSQSVMVITPDIMSDMTEVAALIEERRYFGPTIVIMPKWFTQKDPELARGWVRLVEPVPTQIELSGDKIATEIASRNSKGNGSRLFSAFGAAPKRPASLATFEQGALHPIVQDRDTEAILVGYYADGGDYDIPVGSAPQPSPTDETDYDLYPLMLVADADLFNNKGLADRATALHALRLIKAVEQTAYSADLPILFDLTVNGLGRSENLLTLAFRPPFLAATLCLLVAALMAGWMAFTRFAPARLAPRVIDFGKETLVRNSAATIRLLRREHLLRQPYAALVANQARRRLNLPAGLDDAALDERLDAQTPPDIAPFSARRATLLAAQSPHDIAAAALQLHHWQKEYL